MVVLINTSSEYRSCGIILCVIIIPDKPFPSLNSSRLWTILSSPYYSRHSHCLSLLRIRTNLDKTCIGGFVLFAGPRDLVCDNIGQQSGVQKWAGLLWLRRDTRSRDDQGVSTTLSQRRLGNCFTIIIVSCIVSVAPVSLCCPTPLLSSKAQMNSSI